MKPNNYFIVKMICLFMNVSWAGYFDHRIITTPRLKPRQSRTRQSAVVVLHLDASDGLLSRRNASSFQPTPTYCRSDRLTVGLIVGQRIVRTAWIMPFEFSLGWSWHFASIATAGKYVESYFFLWFIK